MPATARASRGAAHAGVERRSHRSDDTITALHYQLSAARSRAELDALVLVDNSGCLVAGAGAWPICEELAAYAPLLADPSEDCNATVGSRIAALSSAAFVHTLRLDGGEAVLCGRGGVAEKRRAVIAEAATGCRRILHAAA